MVGGLRGKTVVVTGASSGLGLEVAAEAAARGAARTVLAVRNLAKGEAARAAVLSRAAAAGVPDANVEVQHLDLADLASVRTFSAGLEQGSIDCLVNNAGGLHKPDAPLTVDGHHAGWQVNVLAPTLLARLLAPALRRAEGGRVIFVGSRTEKRKEHAVLRALWSNDRAVVGAMDPTRLYGTSKLGFHAAALALARMEPGVKSVLVTPGMVNTPLFETPGVIPWALGFLSRPLRWLMLKTVAQGAASILDVMERDDVQSGSYYHDGANIDDERSPESLDETFQDELWRTIDVHAPPQLYAPLRK